MGIKFYISLIVDGMLIISAFGLLIQSFTMSGDSQLLRIVLASVLLILLDIGTLKSKVSKQLDLQILALTQGK